MSVETPSDHPISHCKLPEHLRRALDQQAIEAAPQECCGLLLGSQYQVTACAIGLEVIDLVPSPNIADEPTRRFEIDPRVQLKLLREADGDGPKLIGCYHSHPHSAPEPSETDRTSITIDGFLWLIHGSQPDGMPQIRAFLASLPDPAAPGTFTELELVES